MFQICLGSILVDGKDLVEEKIWRFRLQRLVDIDQGYPLVRHVVKTDPVSRWIVNYLVAGAVGAGRRGICTCASDNGDIMTRINRVSSMTHKRLQRKLKISREGSVGICIVVLYEVRQANLRRDIDPVVKTSCLSSL